MYGRVDLAAYKSGLAVCRNFFVDYRGGVASRPGTQYIATSQQSGIYGISPILVPFQFNTTQSYVLEFGGGYIAFYKNGAQITSGGLPYTIATPYALADLALLKFCQSADVLTITHPSYQPANLNRFADTNWTLVGITFAAAQGQPTALTFTQSTPPTVADPPGFPSGPPGPYVAYGDSKGSQYVYKVTAVNSVTGEESLPSAAYQNPTGLYYMSGSTYLTNQLTWTAPALGSISFYNIYREEEVPNGIAPSGSIFGYLGAAIYTFYADHNGLPNFSLTPPNNQNPFPGSNDYPACSCYFQQRLVFAGSNNNPETLWMTQPGNITNMNNHYPSQPADAIIASIASIQVNAIRALVPMAYG